ncbi:hypothetical protein DU500_08385 [Haloplanus rubicundus]|uniref:Uncharacterized protein n=1 Tax=Haloplanus rubicundus TaxID=1547898 RepID=A0A345E2L2_9EURY|nr:hypothetical protein [Haloplanus rubicundus]AXG06434.1 hypothetical protein DU500_08385 [Haloplanus rubicundus]
MPLDSFTRRRILAAVGSAGALYLGVDRAGAALGYEPVDLNQRTVNGTYARTNEFTQAPPRIALSWREIVNGERQEDTGLTTDAEGETGDVGLVVDEAVMPGDSGSVTMRAELLERDTPTVDSVALYLLLRLSDTAENGVNEPELDAGDSPGEDGGELQDHTEISVWIDEGIFTGNGELEELPVIGDNTVAEGTLAEVADPNPKETGDGEYRIRIDGTDCFSPGDEVYVSFEWRIPDTVGNIIQSDSATFQVAFDPRPCTEG